MNKKTFSEKLSQLFESIFPSELILAQETMADGTVISFDKLEPGGIINVVTSDNSESVIPDGNYCISNN